MKIPRIGKWAKILAIVPPVLIGVGAIVMAVSGREPPTQSFAERVTVVRAIKVPKVGFTPTAIGYGTVSPEREWKAVAQVDGRVTEMHPRLKTGETLPAGAVLLRIDPTDYTLAIAETDANIRGGEAEIAELDARKVNLNNSIVIERRQIALDERDMERKRKLIARGNVSAVALDAAQQTLLGNRQQLQELANTLNLIPAQRGVIEAKLAQLRARLDIAKLDLARTNITAPFAMRLGPVNVETTQFVRRGEILAEGSGMAVAEIAAQFSVDQLFPLIPPEFDPSAITPESLGAIQRHLGFSAVVHLRAGRLETQWAARFARMGDTIDPRTRTIGVIVAVDQPYRKARPGVRPALIKGMFVEVELRGKPRSAALLVPRTALHGSNDGAAMVYVVDGKNRLRRRNIGIGIEQTEFVTVEAGLTEGELLVITDPVPAIDGMLLKIVHDAATETRLRGIAAKAGSRK
ncbi:MAG: efflux RND transporter periplasmic adaptor subunit [Pseudomonadota bacterium]|nr:efflux RND transporter periplasmic adaptor subunit [Pseudomonadota bacterium]